MDRRLRFGPPFSPLMGFGTRFFDDHFDHFDRPSLRPYWNDHNMLTSHKVGDGVDVVDTEKEFSVSLDVSQFEPEELKVNIVDNQLIVEARHAEKMDKYGQIERSFTRKYQLPAGVKGDEVKSELSKEGTLTVRYDKQPENNPKVIPIQIVPKTN